MTPERRNLLIALGAVLLVVVGFLLVPRIQRELAPQPTTAWVAIQPQGSSEAVVETVELAAGSPFRLHAVLEARRRDGSKVYYTQAPALRIGQETVAAEDLRPWEHPEEVKVLWFTVEGAVPYLELRQGDTLDRFRLTEFLRVDWPQAWSIPGRLEPSNDDALVRQGARGENPFGTQRYHVRVELYKQGSGLIPTERYRSWAADEVMEKGRDFPTVIESLPGAIGPASALFGLTQIEPPSAAGTELQRQIQDLTRRRVAFSRLTALDSLLKAVGRQAQDLRWRLLSLDAGIPWSEERGVAPGSLLRVGDRVVVLYLDQGQAGVLDREDLCFDYARGAAVRPLADVFVGGGEVELAPLAG